ncbi:hypothetical protein ACHAXR_011976, partial [Thalassiosira sp. AJA248-18]
LHINTFKKDLLSRTIVVASVLPLGVEKNKDTLRRFMEHQYGPVQKVGIDKKGRGKFPRGRVTFNYKKDAEKLFGGMSLMEASKERIQVKIPCSPVGYKGSIIVRPSPEYKGMLQDDLNTSNTIQVNTNGFSLGHWFPQGTDIACGDNLPGLEAIESGQTSTWVEENPTVLSPILSINMEQAVVELDLSHSVMGSGTGSIVCSEESIALALGVQNRIVLSFRFKDLAHPMELCRHKRSILRKERFYICFALVHPPRLSSIQTNLETEWESRTRLIDIDNGGSSAVPGVGSCFGYRLEVSLVEINRMLKAKSFRKLKNMGLFRCEEELDFRQQAEVILTEQVNDRQRRKLDVKIASLPYHRHGLLLRSILDSESSSWFDMLNDKVQGQDLFELVKEGENDIVERVLSEMRDLHGKTRYPAQIFHALYEADVDVEEVPRTVPEFCVKLPRILITPCRLCVTGFEVEMSNRLVRKFIENESFSGEAFIRVSIGDENTDKLFSDDLSTQVEARISSLVLNGIVLGKKKYLFLAYSSSQLKEQSMWMVCPEYNWSITQIRRSMGDFSMCLTAAKYAARMGQCFSTTIDTTFGAKEDGQRGLMNWARQALGFGHRPGTGDDSKTLRVKDNLPDITSYGGHEHSDGVDLIRKEVLESVLKQVPFGPKYKKDISAIQIRYGGAKGVLVAWDFDKLKDRRCGGYDVCLRPSMVKFVAPYDTLEVVTLAKNIPYYLNRNVILLGSYHGISDGNFREMQAHHLSSLNKMLVDASFAQSFLPQLGGPDNGLTSTLCHMLNASLKPDTDPFLYSSLHAIRSHHLMNLRKKARIHIEKGVVLIGGIDESGLLPENCIFLQVPRQRKVGSSQEDDDYEVVEGRDMRMLTAINIPELRDKKNVVLFSQHGDRPEADKMSGSDLDGDQFAITWDRRLFLKNPSQPMDYTPQKASEANSITDDSLLEHFINHARNDNLGRIAMLWMDHAVIEKSAGCSACLDLAKLASIAVDFPKSGTPAAIPKELILNTSTPRAHWRERRGSPSFHCESIVGQLYDRIIDEMKSQHNTPRSECTAMAGRYRDNNGQILHLGDAGRISDSKISIYNPLISRRLGWKGDGLDALILGFAEHQQYLYEMQLLELMNQYKIKSEGEVATGCILKYHKLHKRRRHDVSEEVRRQFRSIRKTFRSEFFTAVYHLVHGNTAFFDNVTDDEIEYDVADEDLNLIEDVATESPSANAGEEKGKVKHFSCRLAAAYYMMTYSPDTHTVGSKSVLYSFPWVVAADVIACGVSEGSSYC